MIYDFFSLFFYAWNGIMSVYDKNLLLMYSEGVDEWEQISKSCLLLRGFCKVMLIRKKMKDEAHFAC